MPSTGISGITVDAAGHRIIDKEHRGVRIYVRLGPISEEEAEQRLDAELNRIEAELERRVNFRPRFTRSHADCAPPAYQPKIGKLYLATPIIPWPATTRVRMSVACSVGLDLNNQVFVF